MRLILLGAPGAGKGTQAEIISEKFGIPVVGTGNIIREEMRRASPAGLKAKTFVDCGSLVPDDIVIEMIKSRIEHDDCRNGFILDGFPRTVAQAEALDAMGVSIDRVLKIYVADDRIVNRMGGRRVCRNCGSSYHIEYKLPVEEGKCDKCGGELVIRDDDKPETVRERLRIYHKETELLSAYYRAVEKLSTVEGQEEVAGTTRLTLEALQALMP